MKVGFTHTKQVNYVRRPGTLDVMSELKSKHRTHIKAAAKILEIVEPSAEEFVNFYQSNLEALGQKSYGSLAILKQLLITVARNEGRCGDAARRRVQRDNKSASNVPYDAAILVRRTPERSLLLFHAQASLRHIQQKSPHPAAIKLLF